MVSSRIDTDMTGGGGAKYFNSTAVCVPSKHYMVDRTDVVQEIKKMVDDGRYFTVNRARQYGKTTTLLELCRVLQKQYLVLNLSFEGITNSGYRTEGTFVQSFMRLLLDQREYYDVEIPENIAENIESLLNQDSEKLMMDEMFRIFRRWIAKSRKAIVLIIDEVDNASNNQVFLDFLGLLRSGYIVCREPDI